MTRSVGQVNRGRYAEAFNSGIQFSVGIDKENKVKPLFDFTTCKDFINDVVWSELFNKPSAIYSFKHNPTGELKNFVLIVKDNNLTQQHVENLKNVFAFWENKLKFPNSNIELSAEGYILINFTEKWYERFYYLALFTMLTFLYKMQDVPKTIEDFITEAQKFSITSRKGYFNTYSEVLKNIYNNKIKKYNIWDENSDINRVHNFSGLTALKNEKV